jgi:HEAT repeat protein
VQIGQPAVGTLLAAVERRDSAGYAPALDVLAAVGAPDAAHLFASALADADPHLREAGIRGLGRLGAPAVPMLLARLSTAEPTLRDAVVAVAAAVGAPAVPALMERARHGSDRERSAANAALEQIATPGAVFHTYQRRWATAASAVSR